MRSITQKLFNIIVEVEKGWLKMTKEKELPEIELDDNDLECLETIE